MTALADKYIGNPILYSGAPIAPVEIKFYPNPPIEDVDWWIGRNGDSATDGLDNVGTLRYCMTNMTAGDKIAALDTLQDTASSGYANVIMLTSTLPTGACTIYGNNKTITATVNNTFHLFPDSCNVYSTYFRGVWSIGNYAIFGGLYNNKTNYLYGCYFYDCSTTGSYLIGFSNNKIYYENCHVENCFSSGYYNLGAGPEFNNGNIINVQMASLCSGSSSPILSNSYISARGLVQLIYNGVTGRVYNCYLDVPAIGYNPPLYAYNNILKNCGGWVRTIGVANPTISNIFQNTFIFNTPTAQLFLNNNVTGTAVTFNIYNNLFITPSATKIISNTGTNTFVVNESDNRYMALNVDVLLPNSNREVAEVGTIIDIYGMKVDKDGYGVNRPYYNPKGNAINDCPLLATPTDDYLGNTRGNPTDCGALETA